MNHVILTSVAVLAIGLSGVLQAQTGSDKAADAVETQQKFFAETDAANNQPPGTAEQFKHQKVDEATAADAKFQANRTHANMLARDKAEAEAAASTGLAEPTGER